MELKLINQSKTKRCKCCLVEKDIDEFYTKRQAKDGRNCYCKECCRIKAQYYRDNFPERVKEIAQKTRIKNREKIRIKGRVYYKTHYKDNEDYKAKRKANFDKNKEARYTELKKRRDDFNRKWKRPCEKCGEARLYLIQFHHIEPKTKLMCIGANASCANEEMLVKEVKKCVCLCSNCHDEFHYLYGSRPKQPLQSLEEYLNKKLEYYEFKE